MRQARTTRAGLVPALLLAVAAAAAAPAPRARAAEPEWPRLPGGEPVLRMPFPAGTAVHCLQGNDTARGNTHAKPYSRHGIDFSDPSGQARSIVAAAPGVVVTAFTGAVPGNPAAGYNFGNHVEIDHGGGFTTLYAHLDRVDVKAGQRVSAAHPLGTMGRTGNAGPIAHLHWSLHRGDGRDPAVSETVPMHALVAIDLDDGAANPLSAGRFRPFASLELRGAGPERGRIYGSENAAGRPIATGPPSAALAKRLSEHRDAILQALGDRDAGAGEAPDAAPATVEAIVAAWPERGARWTLARLEAIAERSPGDAVAAYWIAVIARRDFGDDARAVALLRKIVDAKAGPPAWPAWLVPWSRVRLGIIAEGAGKTADAVEHYRAAIAAAGGSGDDGGSGYVAAAREGLARIGK